MASLSERTNRMNLFISSKALAGNTDCSGPITIYWKREDCFLFAYIEDSVRHTYRYLLFRCNSDPFTYERECIHSPTYGVGWLPCLYDCLESKTQRLLGYAAIGIWGLSYRNSDHGDD